MEEVDALVGAWTAGIQRERLTDLLREHRVPHAPVRDLEEVVNDPNMHARGSLQWIEHPEFGRVPLTHSPIRYEGTALLPLEPSGRLGAQNDAVFGDWLGLSAAEIEQLSNDDAV